jgi:potassium-transporting ATPase KdpC subunit
MPATTLSMTGRQLWASLRAILMATVFLGLVYPLVITGIAQLAFHDHANGSLLHHDGTVVGSSLIGQSFAGNPAYFQSRPSAAGEGYDPLATSASNLGPTNRELLKTTEQRRAAAAKQDDVPPGRVPADALQASGSGLDPGISPAYAAVQVERVARVRQLSTRQVRALVTKYTQGRDLGFLGEPQVNVLRLNLALDRLSGPGSVGRLVP